MTAPAKLNLFLRVLGRRPDGFHELESVMQTIDLCDRLSVERTAGRDFDFTVAGRECPEDDGNLVVRAMRTYFSAMRRSFGLSVNLEKRIPIGAGLGGGSADAAAMLIALNQLAEGAASKDEMEAMAAALGSDVPFFLAGGTAIARGRGERIEPLPARSQHRFCFVLYCPPVAVPTARIYSNLKLDLTIDKSSLVGFVRMLDRPRSKGPPHFYNALERPFREVYPELAVVQDRISEETGHAFHVTGSGSAMFAAVSDPTEGERAVSRLQAVAAGETYVCESLPGFPG